MSSKIPKSVVQQIQIQMEHPIQPDDISHKDPSFKSFDASQQNIHFSRSDHNIPSNVMESDIISSSAHSYSQQSAYKFQDECTYRFETQQELKFVKYLYLFSSEQIQQIPQYLFLPSSIIYQIWVGLQFYINLAFFIYLPLRLGFTVVNINAVFIGFKALDMLWQCVSAYAQNGQIINDWNHIIHLYLHQKLMKDALIMILLCVFDLITGVWGWVILLVVFVLQLSRFNELYRTILLQCNLLLECFNFIYLLILINLLVCIWNQSFDSQLLGESTYLSALYYVLTTLTLNCQYTPINDNEIIILSLFTALIPIIMGIVFVFVQRLVANNYKDLSELNSFFQKYKINNDMKHQILSDLKFEKKKTSTFSSNVLKSINHARRLTVLQNYFKGYTTQTLHQIAKQSVEIHYEPNQLIISTQNQEDQSIYFILEGSQVLTTHMGESITSVQAPSQFGEIAFFTQMPRSANLKAETNSMILKLDLNRFLRTISFKEKELYFLQREFILYHKIFPMKCFCCDENTHLFNQCPELTYVPDKIKLIKTFLKHQTNQRRNSIRKRKRNHYHKYSMIEYGIENADRLMELYDEIELGLSQISSLSQIPYDDVFNRETSFDRREKSNKLSNIQKLKSIYDQGDDDDDIQYLIRDELYNRNEQQKGTIQTAGFPNFTKLKSREAQLNIIPEYEQEIEDNQDKVASANKVSENDSNNLDKSDGHKSSRSIRERSKQQSQRQILDSSWAQSPIVMYQKKKAQQQQQQEGMKSRTSTQTKSFKTLTYARSSGFQSTFQLNQVGTYYAAQEQINGHLKDFERMHLMEILNPHNNYDVVIALYNKQRKVQKKTIIK